jgi:hypothetical protein
MYKILRILLLFTISVSNAETIQKLNGVNIHFFDYTDTFNTRLIYQNTKEDQVLPVAAEFYLKEILSSMCMVGYYDNVPIKNSDDQDIKAKIYFCRCFRREMNDFIFPPLNPAIEKSVHNDIRNLVVRSCFNRHVLPRLYGIQAVD